MLETDQVLEKAGQLRSRNQAFALVTVVRCESPTSARPGAKALVYEDGSIEGWIGGGCAQPAVIKTAKKALQSGQACLIRISPDKDSDKEEGIMDFGMTCHSGGTLDIFIDPVVPRPMLLILGSAPAALALSALAHRVGFSVTAAFPGAESGLVPDAHQVINRFTLDGANIRPSFVVVATQGKRDEEALEAALATGAPHIAFIASRRKADKLRQFLLERGHDTEAVGAIVAPAGIEIGAVTPEEIALSVLADLVRVRRTLGIAASGMGRDLPAASAVAVEAIDPVCGMDVEIAGAAHVADYQGQKYFFCCARCRLAFEKTPQQFLEKSGAVG